MVLRYLQMDVFAARPGMGNALGAVIDGERFDPARMQAFAAWTNLSETIFLLPPTTPEADYRVRIFTPRSELPFAGHPSVGAAWAVLESGLVAPERTSLVQECAAGLLPVQIEHRDGRRRTAIRAPRARRVGGEELAPALMDAVASSLRLGALEPALWDNGPKWWLLELTDAEAVRSLRPDLPAIAALTEATGAVGLAVHAPEERDNHHLVVRAFCPADGISEDPVTGSAQAGIAARLAHAGRLPGIAGCYVGSQGRELGRDGRVEVQVDAAGDVFIGGDVVPVIVGTVAW
ncbi:PhzF family phenazine biosynthesis protein [Lysobacter brunescens]|uniref:PhzF family phenazine biosynthesis protein n=1 Tax=Lysobacter brunescens TaxID=262323 RepID=A0ABW2YJP6_9GAMM